MKAVQTLLGHATAWMTLDLYSHLRNDSVTRAADLMAQGLAQAFNGGRPERGPAARGSGPRARREGSGLVMGSRGVAFALGDVVAVATIMTLTCGFAMVGVTGFEPATSSSRTKRATKLRHTPWQSPPCSGSDKEG